MALPASGRLRRRRGQHGGRALYGQKPLSILLPLVTRAAKGLQIGEVVRAAARDGNDMVHLELNIGRTSATFYALVVIALQYIPTQI